MVSLLPPVAAGLNPEPFMRRAFAGLWEQELNLTDPATVAKLADEAGLPGEKLVTHAVSDEISAAYEQNRQDAIGGRASSGHPAGCSTVRFSGARTGSNCWLMR